MFRIIQFYPSAVKETKRHYSIAQESFLELRNSLRDRFSIDYIRLQLQHPIALRCLPISSQKSLPLILERSLLSSCGWPKRRSHSWPYLDYPQEAARLAPTHQKISLYVYRQQTSNSQTDSSLSWTYGSWVRCRTGFLLGWWSARRRTA